MTTETIVLSILMLMVLIATDFAQLQYKEWTGTHTHKMIIMAHGEERGNRLLKFTLLILGMFTPIALYYIIRKRVFKK